MEKKQVLINNLYALRAGLSVISEQKDEVDKEQAEYVKQKNSVNYELYQAIMDNFRCNIGQPYKLEVIQDGAAYEVAPLDFFEITDCPESYMLKNDPRAFPKKDAASFTYGLTAREEIMLYYGNEFDRQIDSGEIEAKIQARVDAYKKQIENCEEAIVKEKESVKKRTKKRRAFGIVFLTIAAILIVLGVVGSNIFGSAFPIVRIVLFVVGAILFLVGLIRSLSRANDDLVKSYSKTVAELTEELNKKLAIITMIKNREAEYAKLKDATNGAIQQHQTVCDNVYKVLNNQYGSIVDVRDWKYLDLIIYYLETGRADTMKEALQQLDKERQTKRIVGAIKTATAAICNTIHSEMSELRSTIQTGFAGLQQSIDSGFAQLSAIGQAQLEQMSLANALQAKANTTSEQLANDVAYMRKKLTY